MLVAKAKNSIAMIACSQMKNPKLVTRIIIWPLTEKEVATDRIMQTLDRQGG